MVAIFLLLGAVVNVAVAWGCALWIDGMAPELFPSFVGGVTAEAHPHWRVLIARGRGSTVVLVSGATRKPYPRGPLPADATKEEIDAWLQGKAVRVPRDVVQVPYWSRASTPPTQSDYETPSLWEDARGWPMRSLVSFSAAGQEVLVSGLHVASRELSADKDLHGWRIDLGGTQGPMNLPRVLPLRPILLGFVIDSLSYAAILWPLICGPFALRRHIRRKRGLCVSCGYDLRHADHEVCPECGAGANSATA